jgi:hypothetical protein
MIAFSPVFRRYTQFPLKQRGLPVFNPADSRIRKHGLSTQSPPHNRFNTGQHDDHRKMKNHEALRPLYS